jgi:hypothetical protein
MDCESIDIYIENSKQIYSVSDKALLHNSCNNCVNKISSRSKLGNKISISHGKYSSLPISIENMSRDNAIGKIDQISSEIASISRIPYSIFFDNTEGIISR